MKKEPESGSICTDQVVGKQRVIQKIAESGLAYHDLENLLRKAGKEGLVAVLS